MFLSHFRRWTATWRRLAMRLSWRQLPPVTTHGIALLVGTLLVKPQQTSRSQAPRQILVPVELEVGALPPREAYTLILPQSSGPCQLLPERVRVWRPDAGKSASFIVLPRTSEAGVSLQRLLSVSKKKLRLGLEEIAACGAGGKVRYDP